MKLIKHYIFLIFLVFLDKVHAQNQTANQLWGDYTLIRPISELNKLDVTLGYIVSSPSAWRRLYVEGVYNHKLRRKLFLKKRNHTNFIAGGLSLYHTNNLDTSNSIEIRPSQSFTMIWPDAKRLQINHQVKLEERFEIDTEDWSDTFGLRLSYKFKMTFKLNGDLLSFTKGFYLPVSVRLFWNLIGTQQFNDQARITPGIGYIFNPKWKGEFLVGYNFSKSANNGVYQADGVVFRIRLFHTQGGE